ncbi:hypothetical protein EDB83DRAFT_2318209 [Lactarius deliciosus]|nr:hypothetical protein EDB83DRAFT_2318209 [Lactarius deliciosus]
MGGVGGDVSGPSGAPAWWWHGTVGVACVGGLVTWVAMSKRRIKKKKTYLVGRTGGVSGDASGLSGMPAWWWRGAVGVAWVGVLVTWSVAWVVSVAMCWGCRGEASESEVATLWAASELAWWWWALQMALGVPSQPKPSSSLSARVLHVATAWCQGGAFARRGDGGGELEANAKDDGGGYGVDVCGTAAAVMWLCDSKKRCKTKKNISGCTRPKLVVTHMLVTIVVAVGDEMHEVVS